MARGSSHHWHVTQIQLVARLNMHAGKRADRRRRDDSSPVAALAAGASDALSETRLACSGVGLDPGARIVAERVQITVSP